MSKETPSLHPMYPESEKPLSFEPVPPPGGSETIPPPPGEETIQEATQRILASGGVPPPEGISEQGAENAEAREYVMEEFRGERAGMLEEILRSEMVSLALDFVPFVGGGKMLTEAMVGETLSGDELTGKGRLIHAAVGSLSLVLDFVGVGEVTKAGAVVGKSVGWMGRLSVMAAEKGFAKAAVLFEKTMAFMVKNPDLVMRAEKAAEVKLRAAVRAGQEYKRGNRDLEPQPA